MSDYLQDLVQNIYTNCDMSGFDDYNRAVKNLCKTDKQSVNERISLYEKEEKLKVRLRDYEDRYSRKKKRRDLEEISRMNKRNGLIRTGMRLLGAYLSIRTLQNIIQTGSQLQLLQRSIEGLTGSGQDWQFINEQAFKFGVSLDTVAKGYKNFFSSANMAGFNSSQIQGMFSDVLLGARSIGASTQQIEGALLALEQMMSKGRVSMEELRRQLGNALPGAFEIGAKAMGVTTMQFNEMVKAGISAQEFVPKFIKTFKEQYAKGWIDVEQTVAVAQGRLQVAWQQFTMEFLHGETGKTLARGINQLANVMSSPEFLKFIRLLGKIFSLVVKILSFAVKNIGIILVLLGTAGLTGALQRIIGLSLLLGRVLKVIYAGHVIRGISILTKALFGLSLPVVLLYGKVLAAIAALLVLEDIYTGLFHKEKESFTKDYINSIADPTPENIVKDETSGYFDTVNRIKYGSPYRVTPKTIQGHKDFIDAMHREGVSISAPGQKMFFTMPSRPQVIPNANLKSDASGFILEKDETNERVVTIGDVHFYFGNVNDPYKAADIMDERLSLIMLGQMGGVST